MLCTRNAFRAFVVVFVAALAAPSYAFAADRTEQAKAFITNLADNAIESLGMPGLSPELRRQRFAELFNQAFAVGGIARFAVGRFWRDATMDEKKAYLQLFQDVTVNQWADRFANFTDQRFTVLGARESSKVRPDRPPDIFVFSQLSGSGFAQPVRIDWRVASVGDSFKIVDVFVGAVSLVSAQRDEFISVIRNKGGTIEGLITALRMKREEQTARIASAANL